MKPVHLFASLVACASALPKQQTLHARRLLGSSFGIAGINASYDYVIVGGGTAGLTLATRLAEQQAGTVAVVEAGGFYEVGNGNLSQVPAADNWYAGKAKSGWQPKIDWGYVTAPQAVSSDESDAAETDHLTDISFARAPMAPRFTIHTENAWVEPQPGIFWYTKGQPRPLSRSGQTKSETRVTAGTIFFLISKRASLSHLLTWTNDPQTVRPVSMLPP